MKIHRFIGRFDLGTDRFLIREPALVHQMRAVLKLQPGEKVTLADGLGREALAEIVAVGKPSVEVKIVERIASAEPSRIVILYCALLKRDNFEYACQKATECGVSRIVPLVTARTVKLGLNADRLAKIVQEAAEQSGRGRTPEISAPQKLADAMKDARKNGENVFLDVSGGEWKGPPSSAKSVGVWIGPEGGWEDSEIKAAGAAGLSLVSLGKLTLRAETAATVAVYLAAR